MLRFFVTGTDTGIGKTWVSLLLIDALKSAGYDVAGFKPLACGSTGDDEGRQVHEDALSLQARSSLELPYELVNPVCLREPTAPDIAAAKDKQRVCMADLIEHTRSIELFLAEKARKTKTALVCEGVGGWDVPINERESMSDYACLIKARIVLVIGLRLGCLNHSRLSHRAIVESLRRHGGDEAVSRLSGMIINCLEADYPFTREYIQSLQTAVELPLLAIIPHLGQQAIELPGHIFG